MKRTLSFMVMALALLLTQCRKPEVKFPTPSASEGVTVSMTVTAGPGSKTDITTAGVITWSSGDKLYVGDGEKYIGFLTLVGDGGSATGTFTGNVTLTGITEGIPQTFHFFYLGSVDYTDRLTEGTSETVDVDFSSQNIYADVNNKADVNKKLVNASAQHVGYGSANGTVTNDAVTGINVTLVSKVALARFSFTDGTNPYTGELTLSGDHIYNSMTVNFGGTCTPGTIGNIILADGHAERYVMLVPPTSVSVEDVTFKSGNIEGGATFNNGIEANKFYGQYDAMAVTVKAKPSEANASASAFNGDVWNSKFSVGAGTKVEFSPGNLWADPTGATPVFHFESNQWDTKPAYSETDEGSGTWDPSHVSHFKWSDAAHAVTDDLDYSGKLFCADNFTVTGDSHTWRTLTMDEWVYLLDMRTVNGGTGEGKSYQRATINSDATGVYGMLLYPDGYTSQTGATTYTAAEFTAMEQAGVVFLPAAGVRSKTGVLNVGSGGVYWSSTPIGQIFASSMYFRAGIVSFEALDDRSTGYSVRLVR